MGGSWIGRLLPTAALFVSSACWSATAIYIDSPPGDWIGQGDEHTFVAPASSISASADAAHRLITISWDSWRAEFNARTGSTLAVGNYDDATRYPFNSAANNGLSITAPGRGCNQLEGWFEIHEVVYSGTAVLALAVDLIQSCDGQPALFGAVRINSNVPLQQPQPYSRVATPLATGEGELVLLDGLGSFDRDSTITYEWVQTQGTSVTLDDPAAARPGFIAPAVAPGGEALRFGLTVRDTSGNSDSQSVDVTVHDETDPRTRAFVDSDSGDWVGQGLTYWYDEANARITTGPAGSVISVDIDGDEEWTADFALPQGATWQPGMYAGATRYPFQTSAEPGIDFSGEGRGCNQIEGWFEVVEVQIVGSTVMRLAVDFEQHCEGGSTALRGAIRINSSVPLHRDVPYAVVPPQPAAGEGETVTLDGSASSGNGPLTYQWTQTGGTPVTLSNANGAVATFTAPDVAPGGDVLTFELKVTDANGHTDTMIVTVRVADGSDPRTVVYVQSPAGDWIGGGQTVTFAPPASSVTARTYSGNRRVDVDFDGWRVNLEAPSGGALTAGNYEGATRYPFNSEQAPGLSVSSPGRGCNKLAGWFEIHEASYSGTTVASFAADLVQSCDGGPALFAAIRFNSAVPVQRPQPYARVTAPAVVTEGDEVLLDGSLSFDRSGAIGSWQWTQLEGPAATLAGAATAGLRFTAPAVPPGGQTLRFRLVVTDADGNADSVVVPVFVHDTSDPRTRVFLDSEAGDWVGAGLTWHYDEGNAQITATYNGGIAGNIDGDTWWYADFVPPQGGSLQPGTFAGATRHPFQSPRVPGLDFSGDGRGCNRLSGWFEVVDLQVVGSTVLSAAIDFRQHCEEGVPALFGAMRINSSVPLERNVPYAVAGPDQAVQEGMDFRLDGGQSWSPAGNALTYFWRQTAGPSATIVDPNSATSAVLLPAGGGDYRFELHVSDGPGRVDVDEVRVLVRARSEAQTYLSVSSDYGDYVGQGLQRFFSTDTAALTVSRNYDNGVSLQIDDGDWWHLEFAGPNETPLQAGTYEDAQRFPFQSAGRPGLSWSGDGRGCNTVTGRFRVFRIAYNPDGSVQTAAIDFEHHCEGATPASRGKLRVNFAPDNEPIADAGADRQVDEGTSVELDGSGSRDLQGAITHAWRQTYGRTVTLSGANTARPSFTPLPLQHSAYPETYTFVLAVTDAEGFTAEDSVSIVAVSVRDSDGDGVRDSVDAFPDDPDEQADTDGDGVGDHSDAFPSNPAESADADGDGVGDHGDAFPSNPAEWADNDGDGVGNNGDAFPDDPNEQADTDGDGVGNNGDAFPDDPAESADADGDGVGNHGDAFPSNPAEWADSDGDGVGNNGDAFPDDPAESADADGDGIGNHADIDSDGDGVDNNSDAFPNDPAESADADGDGVGDHGDGFPSNPAEWADSDGDGVGNNGDAFPNNPAESTDADDDGVGDNADAFPGDATESVDHDADGAGDNADTDDDNDGKPDSTEALAPGGDGNADGIPDSRQAGVASFVDASGALATIAVSSGASLRSVRGIANPDPTGTPADVTFDRGFFGIDLQVTPGGAATVEIRLHGAATPERYVKYGPLASGGMGFYDFAWNGATGAELLPGRIVLHFVDGSRGDADGVENGVIADPGGPAWEKPAPEPTPAVASGGGSPSRGLLLLLTVAGALRRIRRVRPSA